MLLDIWQNSVRAQPLMTFQQPYQSHDMLWKSASRNSLTIGNTELRSYSAKGYPKQHTGTMHKLEITTPHWWGWYIGFLQKSSTVPLNRFSTLFFSMKMTESGKIVLVSCIVDFDDMQAWLRLFSLNLHACKSSSNFSLRKSRRLMIQITKTIFPDSVFFIGTKVKFT